MSRRSVVYLFLLPLLGCSETSPVLSDRLLVYVSIPPQAYFAERLVGDLGDVHVLLPKGASHESYEPKPSQMKELARASLYVRMGVPFEVATWDKIQATNASMRIVGPPNASDTPNPAATTHDHGHGAGDPHIWLNPAIMKDEVAAVAEALASMAPDHADLFKRRADDLIKQLDELDAELRGLLEPVRGRSFWVYHPSWGHFASAYGLNQRAIEQEGKEMGAQALTQLVDEAKRDLVRVVFVDPSVNSRNARVIAQEIGAEVVILDPTRGDYFDNMRETAHAIAEALR